MDKGAHFYKSDFQVHSPRDINWDGPRPASELDRKQYAEEFVAACRQKGLNAVAITDHHDVAFFRYIKDAALAETDGNGKALPNEARLVVFPGMELTLGIPCQSLLLFDADLPVEFLSLALTALGITPAASAADKHAAVKKLDIMSFDTLYKALSKLDPLRDRFIVFPHVADGGYKTLLRKDFEKHYIAMPCVGGYVDGDLPALPKAEGMRRITSGKDKNWGNKPLGLFQTSDSRSRDFSALGAHTTWVKWSKPTAEALRQACLARQSRLSHAEPQAPSIYITRVEISNCKFLGPVVLDLNPQYNALIGGRGTGKSTVLEYLRWALCDQPPSDGEDAELPDFQKRRRDLIKNTLAPFDATATVSFLLNGIPHVVRRRTSPNEVLLKIGTAEFAPCTEADVRNLLPIHAYSQKQLSSVGVKIEELDRFVHAPVKHELDGVHAAREELKSKLRTTYEEVTRHRTLAAEVSKHDLERASLREQIERLRTELKGLADADRAVIAQQAQFEAEERLVRAWQDELQRAGEALATIEHEFADGPAMLPAAETPNHDLLARMHDGLATWFDALRSSVASVRSGLEPTGPNSKVSGFVASLAEWQSRRTASLAAYEDAKKRSAAHESTLKQIAQIEERLKILDGTVIEKQRALQRLGEPATKFADQRHEWVALHADASTLVERQCGTLTTLSNGLIRAQLRRGHRVEAADELLRSALKGTKVRAERYEAFWARVKTAADPVAEWISILVDLEVLASAVVEDETQVTLPKTPILDGLGFTARELAAIARTLKSDAWILLLLQELDDLPEFEYRTREGEYIKFGAASAGQQATALMHVLLNQGGPPLIIDQPEDDLDNKVMDEIVEQLWSAKTRRQLIFSSHNANLVVNGDAELVVCCDYRMAGDQSLGQIKLEGAIDIPEINSEITLVMEGGREAFALRHEKYGF